MVGETPGEGNALASAQEPNRVKVSAAKALAGYNYNFPVSHPSAIADFARNDMLFSSGDSSDPAPISSGEGLDEVKESRCSYPSSTLWFAVNEQLISAKVLSF